jgi:hypothetical protein
MGNNLHSEPVSLEEMEETTEETVEEVTETEKGNDE